MTTNELLGKIRRSARKERLGRSDCDQAILEAAAAGVSYRLIALAAGRSKSSVHRMVVETDELVEEVGRPDS